MKASPAGNVYDKYGTRNPIARWLMDGFLDAFDGLVRASGERRAFEIGCGEGELAIRMARQGIEVRACDADRDIVAEARRRALRAGVDVAFSRCAIEELPDDPVEGLVVCCEVLEHVDDPCAAIDRLASLSRAGHLLASVPREPLWRALNMARGRYLGDWGNTPGHVNHWSRAGFLAALQRRFEIVQTRQPLPWSMALCRPKASA